MRSSASCARARGGAAATAAGLATKQEEVKHGLHRWQQGYRLQELMHEWGHLQLGLFEVMEVFAAAHPEFDRTALVAANHLMITLVNEAISHTGVVGPSSANVASKTATISVLPISRRR